MVLAVGQWTPKSKVRHFGPPHVHPTATLLLDFSFQPPVYTVFFILCLANYLFLSVFCFNSFASFTFCISCLWSLAINSVALYITIFLGPLTRFTRHHIHTYALRISSTVKFTKINAPFTEESHYSI